MTLKLEVGKYYRRENGSVRFIKQKYDDGDTLIFIDDGNISYNQLGEISNSNYKYFSLKEEVNVLSL